MFVVPGMKSSPTPSTNVSAQSGHQMRIATRDLTPTLSFRFAAAFSVTSTFLLVRGPAARYVKNSSGGKRTILGAQPRYQSRNLARLSDTLHRNPRNHVVDVLARHLSQHLGLDYGWRHTI